MHYEELDPISRDEALAELHAGGWERISVALTRLALHDPDPAWLQAILLPYTSYSHPWVRGVAAMNLAHVARLHGQLDLEICIPAIRSLLEDETTREKAQDALDDIELYVVSV